jgi:hypothetical protein
MDIDKDKECDTCRIFVLLGREVLGWGETPPDASQFAIFYRPEGDGYVPQCDWAALGVTPLPPGGRLDRDNMRFFTEPKYGADGNTATVLFVTQLVGRDAAGGRRPPFISQERLSLAKTDGRWTLVERRLDAMT